MGAILPDLSQADDKEAANRKRYASGELSLDVSAMRERLARKGLTYVDQEPTDDH